MNKIIESIDREITRLQQVRAMLGDTPDSLTKASASLPGKRRGRPAGSKRVKGSISPLDPPHKSQGRPVKAKRVMSAEGKAKIAAAQQKRWASVKRAAKKAAKEAATVAAAKKAAKLPIATKTAAKKVVAKKAVAKKVPAKKAVAKKATARRVVAKAPSAGPTTAIPVTNPETSA